MKFINKFLILLLLLSFSVGCEDELELFPEDFKIPEFDRLRDYEESLVGIYSALRAGYGGNHLTVDAWLADDMVISQQNNGQGAFLHRWAYSAGDNTMAALWLNWYVLIKRVNILLENEGNFEDPSIPRMMAEARVLRAMAHLDLYKTFAPRWAGGSELGIPFVTSTLITNQPARNTAAETLNLIEQDLTDAAAVITSDSDEFTVGSTLIEGLLARVAMYREDWNDVVNHTTNVINSAPALATGATYAAMWNGTEARGESIFKVKYQTGDTKIGGNFWVTSLNAPYFNPAQTLMGLYLPGDIRNEDDLFFFEFSPGQWRVNKYSQNSDINLADLKLMRTSEMYLLRAEAYYQLSQEGNALADLDAVRAARIDGWPGGGETGEVLFDAIKTERRKELCFEAYRIFDLKRWNDDLVRPEGDCLTDECTLPADDFRFLFPIPQQEVFANDNMVQNPGYTE